MKKIILISAACIASILTNAQYPSLSGHVTGGIATVSLRYTGNDNTKCEIPPWIIGGGWRTYFMIDGWQTSILSSPASLVDNSEIDFRNNGVGPYLGASPYWKDPNYSASNPVDHWRRTYYNIYTAQYLNHPQQGTVSLAFMHSENKNFVKGSCSSSFTFNHYPNTINPAIAINCSDHATWAGGDPFIDGGKAYYSMVTAAWVHNNAQTNWGQTYFENSMGPIVWPANGYVRDDNTNASSGVGHCSSIIDGDYLYVFYGDWGPNYVPIEEGRDRGIRVARVLKNDALDPAQYRVYYKDPAGNVFWNPSIPAGLNKDNMLNYVKVPGPKGTEVISQAGRVNPVMRFSVAKVANTNYFIGVEEYINSSIFCAPTASSPSNGWHEIALRFSTDLLNWSDRVMVMHGGCWDDFRMRYPILLNRNGWTNTEVDLHDFYILGTQGINKSVNKIRVYIPPPSPSDPPLPIDCPSPDIPCEQPYKGVQLQKDLKVQAEAFPNPARSFINIRVTVPESSRVIILLYDINGKMLDRVDDKMYETGTYNKRLDMTSRSAGVYLIQVKIGDSVKYLKVVKS